MPSKYTPETNFVYGDESIITTGKESRGYGNRVVASKVEFLRGCSDRLIEKMKRKIIVEIYGERLI